MEINFSLNLCSDNDRCSHHGHLHLEIIMNDIMNLFFQHPGRIGRRHHFKAKQTIGALCLQLEVNPKVTPPLILINMLTNNQKGIKNMYFKT